MQMTDDGSKMGGEEKGGRREGTEILGCETRRSEKAGWSVGWEEGSKGGRKETGGRVDGSKRLSSTCRPMDALLMRFGMWDFPIRIRIPCPRGLGGSCSVSEVYFISDS